jgi:hypothetical protein
MIHIGICGLIIPPVLGNYRYFITFIDDYSRYSHFQVIRKKSESLEAFKVFKATVELQRDKNVKAVRSDKGDEYYRRHDETRQKSKWASIRRCVYGATSNFLSE